MHDNVFRRWISNCSSQNRFCRKSPRYPFFRYTASILKRRRFLKNSFVATMGVVAGASGINAVSPWLFREPSGVDTNTSLWTHFQPRHNPPLTKDLRADVVIVGGGYTGLSAAYHVACRG